MKRPLAHLLLLLPLLAGCSSAPDDSAPDPAGPSRAGTWLDAMEQGDEAYGRFDLPPVTWEDVPALLENADDPTHLRRFPTNPFSSQSQPRCQRGMMALWIIETLRADRLGRFPSLNPMILPRDLGDQDWMEASEESLPAAAEAYRAWWREVRDLPEAERRARDPLAELPLHWY